MGAESSPGSDIGYVKLQDIPYRAHWLIEREILANAPPGGRILDAGVSSGYLARRFVQAGFHVDGAELDPTAARAAALVCDRVWVGDLDDLGEEDLAPTYDALLFGDTLEHLRNPVRVLRQAGNRLSPNGVLIVSLPNIANWAIRLKLLFGNFRYSDRGILDRTHLHFYTRRTAIEMIEEAGFEVTKMSASVPVPWVSSPTLCRLAHRVGNVWPSLFAYQFVITARAPQP